MTRRAPRVPKPVRAALDACGHPVELEHGKGDHVKIFVGGRFVGVVNGDRKEPGGSKMQNTMAAIRRVAREIQHQNRGTK